jgi:hypothetical protein
MGNAPQNWVEKAYNDILAQYTRAISDRESAFWISDADELIIKNIKNYRDNTIKNWYNRGKNDTFTQESWNRWKNTAKVHLEALTDWGVSANPLTSAFYDTILDIPTHIESDIKKPIKKVAKFTGEVANDAVESFSSGLLSGYGGIVILAVIAIIGGVYFGVFRKFTK